LINQQRLIDEFMQLVQIDSETGNEREIADVLKQKFVDLGLEVIEDESALITDHGAGNIIATLPANVQSDSSPVVFFTSHMDTVTPGNGIKPRIENGMIVSDGTTILGSDDKAGIATMLEVLRVIKDNDVSHGKIQFLITVGEESGLKGSKNLQSDLLTADFGFAFDSNGPVGHIIVAAPTQARITATIYGKSAHAGVNPEDGISAIQVASYAISQMPLGRIDHETTANIGRFQGGKATNIVCDYVEILAEARSLNEGKLSQQINKMREAFDKAVAKYSAKVDFKHEIMYPSFHFSDDTPVVQKAINAVKRIGRKPELLASGGGSDANVINGYGIPTINLGIGYENIHTTSEKMPITELVKASELLLELIKND